MGKRRDLWLQRKAVSPLRFATAVQICLIVLLTLGAFISSATAATNKPNILLIYVDNLGYGDLGCYGNAAVKTPRIDQLAREGVRCTSFYTVAPSCTPARGALLTGRYPARNGLSHQLATTENWNGIGLPHREKIIPQYLKEAGYTTACFGKWNIGFAPGSRPTERGFDEFLGFRSGNINYFTHTYNGEYDMFRGTNRHEVKGYSTEIFADAACEFIRRNAAKPWFVYLPFNAPHYVSAINLKPGEKAEWQVPAKYLERYGWSADDANEKHRYLAVLTALDDAVGRVLDTIDARGLRDNTTVMFISDMGAILQPGKGLGVASNGRFRDGAPSVYEGGVRVPAIFRLPAKFRANSLGRTNSTMLSHLDAFAMCLETAEIAPPKDRVLDRRRHETDLPPARLVFAYANAVALREGKWKIVRPDLNRPWELYDLRMDPGETKNLAAEKPAIVNTLVTAFSDWEEDVKRDASPPARIVPATREKP